jgi:Ca2+-binding RTX toxin-like protein
MISCRPRALCAGIAALALLGTTLFLDAGAVVRAAPAPVGQGFTVTPSDLAFILEQIKIAERHSLTFEPEFIGPSNPDPLGDPEYCSYLVGPGADQVPDYLTSYGLRTVDGACNNLVPGRDEFAQADQPFPRLTTPVFDNAEPITTSFPVGPPGPTSYQQKRGSVVDSQPRVISNLIVDQTSTNPAAVAAAGFPVRTQHDPGVFPCTVDPTPADTNGTPDNCVPSHQTMFIPNVTTNVGLSPPYNSLFTFFGQFFDHGVDQTLKSGGTVFVPLQADDPLIAGPDHIFGNTDDLSADLRFMVLTRAQNQPGLDGIHGDDPSTPVDESIDDTQDTNNSDSPWVDQSQTYSSHASHQVFLREYVNNKHGDPVSTGKLLGALPGLDDADGAATTGSMSTWASTKKQAADLLGLLLTDKDVTNIPMIAADPYGKFIPGPNRGLPQYVTASGLVEGCRTTDFGLPALEGGCDTGPVPVPDDVVHFDTPFLTDIAHNADPSPDPQTGIAPRPDDDQIASADFARQPAGTYDDEMLNDHFTCGDGRCNENIALSAIHQVFHSEHDRLVEDIKKVLLDDTSASGVLTLANDWESGSGGPPVPDGTSYWDGERLFQAARFVNEMEYQHMVFEEFARKIQPSIKIFEGYSSDINPAIPAEFASAVYRFGHSMLVEDVARTNPDGTDNSIPLLTAFLNPPEFFNGGSAGTLSPQQAAGAIVMGSSDQVGNELDEFVTETLRNNLLGLPLDLATLNLTRARDVGIPPLNDVRRQIFATTNEGQLKPYTSWSDFGQHLKHPESLINFVAAYGTHPSITSATTVAAKRSAARAIVNPLPGDVRPADAAAFMFSTGDDWAMVDGVTTTGLDDVDLWVGGLAEVTNLNGGLLGTTFNYVFQTTLEDLQDGDRFYYVARTAGMNLLSQLEGNSFAEIIERNTDGTHSLKADAFATADCKFQLANLDGTVSGFIAHGAIVADDPTTTDCNESLLLQRKPDGTIQYKAVNSVDPVGINGQSVYTGTPGVDRIAGGNDNDTFWGDVGNDVIAGGGGDDVALGGEGNDIVTDSSGIDTLKGGPGNDAQDGGPDNDLLLGGDGQDFLNGGAGDNTEFGGPGNDFIIAGTGGDVTLGDGGDDWIEGSLGVDLLQGDHGAPFFDDPAQVAPGNDIFVGQAGDNIYDAEGGDDLLAQNAAVDRNVGAGGFDWAFHQFDTVAANDDMNINNNLAGAQPIIVTRDVWQETEADSGYNSNDVIRGTNLIHSEIGGVGTSGCDVLDQAGVDRIAGLAAIVPQPLTDDSAAVIGGSVSGFCPISGNIWGAGDILIGGKGSDTIEGRGGDDIIDGDRFLQARISVRDPFDPAVEIGSTDLMQHKALTGNFGPGTANMTLQQAVFAGLVNPGYLVAVREIVTPTVAETAGNIDTAVFSGKVGDYVITTSGDALTVRGNNGAADDGTDTLRNIEQLSFCNGNINNAGTCSIARTTVQVANLPSLGLSAWSLAFPAHVVGIAAVPQTVTMTNRGGADLTVSGFSISATPFDFATDCDGTLASGEQCTIDVTFTPQAPGPLTAQLSIDTSVGPTVGPTFLVALTGTGLGAPTITQVAPASAAVGATITITGADLTSTTAVTIGGRSATSTPVDATTVTAIVPDAVAPAASVAVIVTTSAGTSTGHFQVTARPLMPPTLTSFTPSSGLRGSQVFLHGDNYTTSTTVTFAAAGGGRAAASAELLSPSEIRVTVPPTAVSGLVEVANGSLHNSLNFVVTPPVVPPVVPPVLPPVTPPVVPPVTPPGPPPAVPAAFTTLDPFRAFDTRPDESGLLDVAKTKLGRDYVLDVPLAGIAGIPGSGVAAVSMNVTVVNSEAAGFVTAFPCDTVPSTSSVNFAAGQTAANAVIATVSAAGHVCFYSNSPTDVVVDVNGWYPTGTGFTAVQPARAFDTRADQNGVVDVAKTKVGGGNILDVQFDSMLGQVGGVAAVSMNVTVDGPAAAGFVTVYPCGTTPNASSVNFLAGQTVANAVITPLSSSGHACFYSSADTDVIVDVNGWFAPGAGFNAVAPARVFDTRAGHEGALDVDKSKIGDDYVLDVELGNLFGSTASGHVGAVSLNVTVDGAQGSGYVTVFPCGSMPRVSSVNFNPGQTVANAATTPVSSSGHVCFYSSVPTDLVVDVNGWFAKSS